MKAAYKVLGLFLAFALALACVESTAQSYPSRPIRLIVGFPPGGTTDLLPRIIGPMLAERIGQAVVIENKPGADGVIGAELVARAAPDGYTLLVGTAGQMVYNPLLKSVLPYDALKDFDPITMIVSDPLVFAVHPSVNVTTIKELIALAKSRPGQLFYSSGAAPWYVTTETLKRLAGVDITHVPYKGGGPSVTAAVAGEVQLYAGAIGTAQSQIRAGKLRALAVTSDQRHLLLPDTPTMRESGLDLEGGMWAGFYAPAGTPSAIIDKLNSEVAVILKSDAIKEKYATMGYDTNELGTSPAKFGAYHRAQLVRWSKAIKDYDIRPTDDRTKEPTKK